MSGWVRDGDEEALVLLDVLAVVDFLVGAEDVAHALEGVGVALGRAFGGAGRLLAVLLVLL